MYDEEEEYPEEEGQYEEPGDNYQGVDDEYPEPEDEDAEQVQAAVDPQARQLEAEMMRRIEGNEPNTPYFRTSRGLNIFNSESSAGGPHGRGRVGYGGHGSQGGAVGPGVAAGTGAGTRGRGCGRGRGNAKNNQNKEEISLGIIEYLKSTEKGTEVADDMDELEHQFQSYILWMKRMLSLDQQYELMDEIGQLVSRYIRRAGNQGWGNNIASAAGSSSAATVMGPPQAHAPRVEILGFPQPLQATPVGDFYREQAGGDSSSMLAQLHSVYN